MKTLYIILFTFCISLTSYSQGNKLKKSKTSLQKEKQSSSTSKISNKRYSKSQNNFASNLFVGIFINLTYGIAVESIFEKESAMRYANISDYPYKKGSIGNFTYDNEDFSLIKLHISDDFIMESSNLYGNNINSKFNFLKRMDVEVDYLQLFEKTFGRKETFSMFSSFINYHRIRTEKLDFWYGIGAIYVGKGVDKGNVAYNIGAEWFVKKPISIYLNKKGTIINDWEVSTTKLGLKYHIKNHKVSAGYQHNELGTSNINAIYMGLGISF